jgi:hypothetical protein
MRPGAGAQAGCSDCLGHEESARRDWAFSDGRKKLALASLATRQVVRHHKIHYVLRAVLYRASFVEQRMDDGGKHADQKPFVPHSALIGSAQSACRRGRTLTQPMREASVLVGAALPPLFSWVCCNGREDVCSFSTFSMTGSSLGSTSTVTCSLGPRLERVAERLWQGARAGEADEVLVQPKRRASRSSRASAGSVVIDSGDGIPNRV